MTRSFQRVSVFPGPTVAETLAVPIVSRRRAGSSRLSACLATDREVWDEMADTARFFGLATAPGRPGRTLPRGDQKRCRSPRALALDPDLLLLDEPFEGLSPAIIPALADSIAAITRLGRSIVIAESNIHHVPDWTHRLYAIERGEIILAGTLEEVRRDAAVLRVIGGNAS